MLENAQGLRKFLKNLATFFGVGFFPKGPGTAGTVATIPLVLLLSWAGPLVYTRRMKPAGVCVSCVHPGAVNSEFGKEGDTTGLSAKLMGYAHFVTIPVDQGADTSIWLATAAAGGDLSRSGTYWFKRRPARLAPWAKREAEPARLWAATEDLVATVENR